LYGSEPGPTARRIGGYLMWTAFAATAVTSSMFITALVVGIEVQCAR
jgi:citrate:succinate antiporter/L-tartrate/succinate antiporter